MKYEIIGTNAKFNHGEGRKFSLGFQNNKELAFRKAELMKKKGYVDVFVRNEETKEEVK